MSDSPAGQAATDNDLPEFWCVFPPGTVLFLAVILLSMAAIGINTVLISGLGSDAYFELSLNQVFLICNPLFVIPFCVAQAMLVMGRNRRALLFIRLQLILYLLIPIPHLLVGPDEWLAFVPIVAAVLAYVITRTTQYQVFGLYYEKLFAWKRERDRRRKDIMMNGRGN